MLNYGYALLISAVRTEMVSAGFDPSIGIAHRRSWNPIPLVYDLMEPLRPVVDLKILEFALANTFGPGDFTINNRGACRLNPQLAKAVTRKVAEIKFGSAVRQHFALLA
jgi:CRISPR/Cas system-associated endonuclease Cas1